VTPPPAASALPSVTDPPPPRARKVVGVGDAVMLSAAQRLSAHVPGMTVDAEEARQGIDAASRIRQLDESGQLGDVLVVHLGVNGPYPATVVDDIVEIVGKRRVVLVNTKVPRQWEDQVNSTVAEAVTLHRNVRLVDWHAVASSEPGLLAPDGYHLTPTGAERYATLVAEAVTT
jgi:hypothetical protein